MGCMALSHPELSRERAEATLVAALEAGVGLLDTADAYAPTPDDVGHNEQLVARVLRESGHRPRVVTKGGLVRKGARWLTDGRAKHLTSAAEASLQRMGGERLDIYLLHAPDPAVPLETSCRALARLHKRGLVQELGVSNVTVEQLERALAVAPISWVQMPLGAFGTLGAEGGVAERARALGVRVLAYRPFGAAAGIKRLMKQAPLRRLAESRGVSPADLVLAWLYALDDRLVALPGPTRPETGARAVPPLTLQGEELAALDQIFPHGRMVSVPREARRPPHRDGDVVVVMGMPGAGKTTRADDLERDGYLRLNRDERGGTLAGLIKPLEAALSAGQRKVVLDNTYPTRASRARVVEAAWRHGAAARCLWIDSTIEQAQVNVVRRMLAGHGRLLEEEEVKSLGDDEPNTYLPRVQFSFRERFETPREDEGFESVERVPFVSRPRAGRPALLVDADQYLFHPYPGRDRLEAQLRTLSDRVFVAGLAWRPPGKGATEAELDALCARLGFPMETVACPHPAGPPKCWCRRPLPGLGLLLEHRHGLDLARSVLVGRGAANAGFAARLGLRVVEAEALTEAMMARLWSPSSTSEG